MGDNVIIQVKVIPKSSKNCIVGFEGAVLKIKCTAVPEKGKANQAVILLLSEYYHVAKSQIQILKGKNSSRKIVQIEGLENPK